MIRFYFKLFKNVFFYLRHRFHYGYKMEITYKWKGNFSFGHASPEFAGSGRQIGAFQTERSCAIDCRLSTVTKRDLANAFINPTHHRGVNFLQTVTGPVLPRTALAASQWLSNCSPRYLNLLHLPECDPAEADIALPGVSQDLHDLWLIHADPRPIFGLRVLPAPAEMQTKWIPIGLAHPHSRYARSAGPYIWISLPRLHHSIRSIYIMNRKGNSAPGGWTPPLQKPTTFARNSPGKVYKNRRDSVRRLPKSRKDPQSPQPTFSKSMKRAKTDQAYPWPVDDQLSSKPSSSESALAHPTLWKKNFAY